MVNFHHGRLELTTGVKCVFLPKHLGWNINKYYVNGISMVSQWFVFLFFIFSIHIYSPSNCQVALPQQLWLHQLHQLHQRPGVQKHHWNRKPIAPCVCNGQPTQREWHKISKTIWKQWRLWDLAVFVQPDQPAVSSNSRNWSMSSRTAHRSRLSTQSTPCAKGLRSPNDAALKDPGDQWRTSGDLKDQWPKSHSVGYIDLFCLVHLVHLRLANMHSSNFAELVGYFFGSVLRPERRLDSLDSAPSVPSLSGEFL